MAVLRGSRAPGQDTATFSSATSRKSGATPMVGLVNVEIVDYIIYLIFMRVNLD
jgi:hypothetical protein